MMNKRLLSNLMPAVFAWMIAGPTMAALLEPSNTDHAGCVPCPDGGDEDPCDGGCPCICCPGHAKVMFTPSIAPFERLYPSSAHRVAPPETDHPSGIHFRVFRPPRV